MMVMWLFLLVDCSTCWWLCVRRNLDFCEWIVYHILSQGSTYMYLKKLLAWLTKFDIFSNISKSPCPINSFSCSRPSGSGINKVLCPDHSNHIGCHQPVSCHCRGRTVMLMISHVLQMNILRLNKMGIFMLKIFLNGSFWKCSYYNTNFTEVCSWVSSWQ